MLELYKFGFSLSDFESRSGKRTFASASHICPLFTKTNQHLGYRAASSLASCGEKEDDFSACPEWG